MPFKKRRHIPEDIAGQERYFAAENYVPAHHNRWLPVQAAADRIYGKLLGRIKPHSEVLEIGPGEDSMIKRYCPGLDPVLLDVRGEPLKAYKGRKVVGSSFRLPFKDGSFDHVVTAHCLDLSTPSSLPKALRSIHRVLKPGGTLITINESVATRPWIDEEPTMVPEDKKRQQLEADKKFHGALLDGLAREGFEVQRSEEIEGKAIVKRTDRHEMADALMGYHPDAEAPVGYLSCNGLTYRGLRSSGGFGHVPKGKVEEMAFSKVTVAKKK